MLFTTCKNDNILLTSSYINGKNNHSGDVMAEQFNELPATRKLSILNHIEKNGSATIKELAMIMSVSEATIRRDLDELKTENKIERTHGGAIIQDSRSTSIEHAYHEKMGVMVEEKTRIGKCAAGYIEDGDSIILDSGTTSMQIALSISHLKNLTVITNDLHIARSIILDPTSKLIVTGGECRQELDVLTGSLVNDFLSRIHTDKTFLSADAVSIAIGVTNSNFQEASIKRAFMEASNKVFLIADRTKFGKTALANVCSLSDIDMIISDDKLSPQTKKELKSITECEFV